MRILSLVALAALAACVSNPDPRDSSQQLVLHDGHGGWIEIMRTNGYSKDGELIAVTPTSLIVLTPSNEVVTEPISALRTAELYEYDTEYMKLGLWGGLGALSTATHGVLLIFSLPVWIVTAITTSSIQSRAAYLSYPGDPWSEFAKWSRFPQGMPPGITPEDLVRQDRTPKPPPEPMQPPAVDAGVDAVDAAVDAAP